MKSHYPNILQSFGLLVIYIGVTVIISMFATSVPSSLGTFVISLASGGITLMLALIHKQAPVGYLFAGNRHSHFSTYILAALFSFSMVIILEPIIGLIPMPDWFKQILINLLKKDIFSFLTLSIIAPVMEELLFRKVLLSGLVKNYGETKGILWSAFFFALLHLNPWQGIGAFFIGIFLAWLYLRTRNIWLCIFVHFFNNTLATVAYYMSDDPFAPLLDYVRNTEFALIMLLSAGCMYFCVRMLQHHFAKRVSPICIEDQEETDQAKPSGT